MHAIADCLTGKRVLVTGAGGSIRSELCRQIVKIPAALHMLDRGRVRPALPTEPDGPGHARHRGRDLCDIRDQDALESAFAKSRPEVVFHAAALKPCRCWSSTQKRHGRPTCWGR